MRKKQPFLKAKALRDPQVVLPAPIGRSSINAQGNRRRAARKSRTEKPESADERTNFGKPRDGPKARQTVTGVAQQRTWTAKTPPSGAKSLVRNRASGRKEMLISFATRAKTPARPLPTGRAQQVLLVSVP
jgi:hypothetical protein